MCSVLHYSMKSLPLLQRIKYCAVWCMVLLCVQKTSSKENAYLLPIVVISASSIALLAAVDNMFPDCAAFVIVERVEQFHNLR